MVWFGAIARLYICDFISSNYFYQPSRRLEKGGGESTPCGSSLFPDGALVQHCTCLDEIGDPAAPPPHGAAGGGDHPQRAGRRVARAEGRRPCNQWSNF